MRTESIPKLLGLGALGASGFFVLIYAAFIYFTLPQPDSGMDWTQRIIAWIGVGGVVLALIAVHVVIGRQLIGPQRRVP